MNNENKPKKHPHAELIKAWADGAKIQIYNDGVWGDCNPEQIGWYPENKYRIKPEEPWKPIPGETYLFITSSGKVVLGANQNEAQDLNRIAIGNCFHDSAEGEKQAAAAAERVKAALKGELKISAPNHENFQYDCKSLMLNNQSLKQEIDNLINNPKLDGKPLTDGEKALIRALRKTKIAHVWEMYHSRIVGTDDDGVLEDFSDHVAFITEQHHDAEVEAIIDALRQIRAEQEAK